MKKRLISMLLVLVMVLGMLPATALAASSESVPGNAAQKKLGIKDPPELLAEDMIREGLGYKYPDKVLTMAKQAMATYEWTVNELHVEWIPDRVGAEGGHSVPRHLFTVN